MDDGDLPLLVGSHVHLGAHARMHVPDVLTSAVALT